MCLPAAPESFVSKAIAKGPIQVLHLPLSAFRRSYRASVHEICTAHCSNGRWESHAAVALCAEDRPFQVKQIQEGVVHMAGPPATCVNIALHNLGLEDVDLVISGPNVGHNAGW